MKTTAIILGILLQALPAWAFVPHEYPAVYTHQLGNVFYLIALFVVLWSILQNRLRREKGWRYFFLSVVFFILWDSAVLLSRVIESGWVEPSQTVGART